MKDYAEFKQDVKDPDGNILFQKGQHYKILGEDDTSLYIQSKPHTNEVSQFPTESVDKVFTCIVK